MNRNENFITESKYETMNIELYTLIFKCFFVIFFKLKLNGNQSNLMSCLTYDDIALLANKNMDRLKKNWINMVIYYLRR